MPPEPPRKYEFVPVAWVNDGDVVWIPWSRDPASYRETYLRCRVVTAMGNHARIENARMEFNKLVHINVLYVEKGQPQAYPSDGGFDTDQHPELFS